jgi:hypothetical protein
VRPQASHPPSTRPDSPTTQSAADLDASSSQVPAQEAKVAVERSYDITYLLEGYSDKIKNDSSAGWATISSSDRADRVDDIKKYLRDNVDWTTWKANGGDVGEIRFDKLKNALLVTQTPEAHRKISIVLNNLRRPGKQPEALYQQSAP